MNKGIIFDLDGTLWDTTTTTYESLKKICENHNIESVSIEQVKQAFGTNIEETAKIYFPNIEINEGIKLVDENTINHTNYLKEYGGNIYEGVFDTIKELSKTYKLFIVSNTAQPEYIEAFLTTSKLKEYFIDYIAASHLNITKSAAIKKIIKDNYIDQAIYIGDTLKDEKSSQEANVPFIFASYGFGTSEKNYVLKLNKFNDLLILTNNLNYKELHKDEIIKTPGGTLLEVAGIKNNASKSIALVTMDEESSGLKHYHDNIEEIYLFTKGKGQIIINDNINEINGPSIYVIPKNNVHYIKSNSKMEFCCICTPPWEQSHEFVSNEPLTKDNILPYEKTGKISDNIYLIQESNEFHIDKNFKEYTRYYYVIEGTGTIEINGITNIISPNNCYKVNPQDIEKIKPLNKIRFVIILEKM